MTGVPSVTVILPTYNEEVAIGKMIDEIEALPMKCGVLVADSESTDRTVGIAKRKGVPVVMGRRGKGNAVRAVIDRIRTPYAVMLDADGTYPVEAIPALCGMLDEFEVVKGNRVVFEDGSMPWLNRMGNRAVSFLASILFFRKVADVDSGMWAFRTGCLRGFDLTSKRFTLEVDLFTNTVRNRHSFAELPIRYGSRASGSRAKIHLRDWLEIGWFLLKRRFSVQEWLWFFSAILLADGIWSVAIHPDGLFLQHQLEGVVRMGIAVCVGLIAWRLRRK
jgi:glycosyltransferase involved in cell wall biosynthesis